MMVKHARTHARLSRLRSTVAALSLIGLACAGAPVASVAAPPVWAPGMVLGGVGPIPGLAGMNGQLVAYEGPASEGGKSILTWCNNLYRANPTMDTALVGVDRLVSTSSMWGPDEVDLTTPQMAWVLEQVDTAYAAGQAVAPERVSATALLVHANYETADPEGGHPDPVATVTHLVNTVRANAPAVWNEAVSLAARARASAAVGYTNMVVPTDNVRHGVINDIAVTNDAGQPIAGIDMKLVIDGPAVFDATGTKEWVGTSASTPLSLTWTATGNGTVTTNRYAKLPAKELTRFLYGSDHQNTLNRPLGDPKYTESGSRTYHVVYDFQPMLESNVKTSKVVDEATTVSDTLRVFADPSYGDGVWLSSDSGAPIPVTFEGRAYYTGERPAAESDAVPADAVMVGETEIVAKGPGEYTASIANPKGFDSSFITWVWTVDKEAQAEPVTSGGMAFTSADFVHADWQDGYGLADETTVNRWPVEIDSAIQTHVTKSGSYLSDDLFIMGMPSDHPDFAGGAGFVADVKVLTQSLLFFPEGVEVSEENKASAEVIGSVDVPAKNGFYPHVGSTSFKVKEGVAGTYVFVTSFAGDDRVAAMTTSVEDETEQFVVEGTIPTLKTTATDKADGDKLLASSGEVTVSDKVCYEGLKVGTEYSFTATLMDKETGKAVTSESGEPVSATVTHTPTKASDCTTVDITVDGSLLAGKKTVVFEDVARDGKTVAVHADINDEGQTVETPGPKVGTTATDHADGDKYLAENTDVVLDDKVCYEGLVPGKEYTLSGTLMDKATGKELVIEGKPVTSTRQFTPKESKGCETVSFRFNTSSVAGKTIVVFENVERAGVTVAVHADINDEGQTVKVAKKPVLAYTGVQAGLLGLVMAALLSGAGVLVTRRRRMD